MSIRSWVQDKFIQKPIVKSYDPLLQTLALNNEISRESSVYDDVKITGQKDIDDTDGMRRAISSINNYYNVLGIFRAGFDKGMNDRLANHPYFVMIEKAIMDYMSTIEFEVVDVKNGENVDKATEFLENPNPQGTFQSITKPMIRDLIRYDAGVWVKTFNKSGYIVEIKPYLGTEFWIEPDRVLMEMTGQFGVNYMGFWTHGYVKRYWQRSVVGIYVPYHPEEVTYFMMYPKSDDVYGTDFISKFKSYFQFLIDSTKAAGVSFHNNLVPSMVLTHPEVATAQQLLSRVNEIESHNKGTTKFGNVLHLIGGEQAQSISNNLIDMQWLEGQKFIGQLIWSTWGFPSSEFIDGDNNRATAYVRRNITKSKMLYPLLKLIEDKINVEILPFMKGYKKSWKFRFVKDLDLDDAQKIAQTVSIKSAAYTTLINTGMKPSVALKVVSLDDQVSEEDLELLDEYVKELDSMPMGENMGSDITGLEDIDQGRYGEGSEGYQEISFGENNGEPDQTPESGDKGIEKSIVYDEEEEESPIKKSRIYIQNPSEAPKGREIRRGLRGGYYYVAEPKQKNAGARDTKIKTEGGKPKKPKSDRSKSSGEKKDPDIYWQPPEPKEANKMYDDWFSVKSDNCLIYVFTKGGKIGGKMSNTDTSKKLINELKEKCGDDFDCMKAYAKKLADKYGYEFLQ